MQDVYQSIKSRSLVIFMAVLVQVNVTRPILAMDKNQFVREYLAATKAYEKHTENLVCKASKKDALRKSDRQIVFSRADGFEKAEAKIQIKQGDQDYILEEVYCLSDDTFFQLLKQPEKKQFVVKSMGKTPKDKLIYHQEMGDFFNMPVGGSQFPLYKRIEQDSDTLTSIGDPDPATGFVRIRFDFGAGQIKESLVADLDPSNHWAVINQERLSEINNMRMSKKFSVKYGKRIDGFAMPSIVTYLNKTEFLNSGMKERIENDATVEFFDWRFEKRPMKEFQLTHFNLPDVPLKIQKGRDWKFLAGMCTVIVLLVVLGFYFRSASRRREASAGT